MMGARGSRPCHNETASPSEENPDRADEPRFPSGLEGRCLHSLLIGLQPALLQQRWARPSSPTGCSSVVVEVEDL